MIVVEYWILLNIEIQILIYLDYPFSILNVQTNSGWLLRREGIWLRSWNSLDNSMEKHTLNEPGFRSNSQCNKTNSAILWEKGTARFDAMNICFQRETRVRRICSSRKHHARALIGLNLRHNSEKEKEKRALSSLPQTVFSKAPCRVPTTQRCSPRTMVSSVCLQIIYGTKEAAKLNGGNHVPFPWGATIIREASFLSLDSTTVQNTEERADEDTDQRPSLGHYMCCWQLGTMEALYLIDSPQTCVTTTSYCLWSHAHSQRPNTFSVSGGERETFLGNMPSTSVTQLQGHIITYT